MNTLHRWQLSAVMACGLLFGGANRTHAERAEQKTTLAELTVEDGASLFSADAILKAKKTVAGSKGEGVRQVHIESFKTLSEAETKELEAAGDNKEKLKAFWSKWGKSKVAGGRGNV